MTHVILTKSFTKNPEAGNPAGVVTDAQDLSDAHILKLAQALGFPESAFLQKSTVADYKLRLFSVKQEVNSCVTATLAAAAVTTNQSTPQVTFETKIGNREVHRRDDGLLLMKQPPVEFLGEQTNRPRIAELLNIPVKDL
ncbi:MAG TPA: PhzF family phenazine biosynthesis protein, partial [Candidatus Saccharimonadales bacterium]|nr:PhzF family phenazine biosynthesis protein [Candidatus Saccharimonadales bacterium]